MDQHHKNLTVVYDSQIFTAQKFGGISRYFVELMRHMPEASVTTELAVKYSPNVYVGEVKPITDFPLSSMPFKHDIIKTLNKRKSTAVLTKGNYDIVHPTYYDPYFLKLTKRPYVVTVHDMIHERFAQLFSSKDRTAANKRLLVSGAEHIIAISQSTKHDLIDIYGLDEEKISVIYHGHTVSNSVSQPVANLPEQYILFVGDRSRYKNFHRMAEAFAAIRKNYIGLKLICTGRPFNKAETEMLQHLGIESDVIQMFVNDGQLKYLYSQARCFVFPSLFEGFGFPILEAFNSDCPAILSNTSSLPEVGGDAAIYFDPYNIDDMIDKVTKVIDNDKLRISMIEKGREIVKTFTWQRTADQTAEVYRKVSGY